jgi:hypothetical protein
LAEPLKAGPLPACAALGDGESSGGAQVVCADGQRRAVDERGHGHGAAGAGKVDRFGGVGNGGGAQLNPVGPPGFSRQDRWYWPLQRLSVVWPPLQLRPEGRVAWR